VDVEHCHAVSGCLAAGRSHGVWDVVELAVVENTSVCRVDVTDNSRSNTCRDLLQADLEWADVRGQLLGDFPRNVRLFTSRATIILSFGSSTVIVFLVVNVLCYPVAWSCETWVTPSRNSS